MNPELVVVAAFIAVYVPIAVWALLIRYHCNYVVPLMVLSKHQDNAVEKNIVMEVWPMKKEHRKPRAPIPESQIPDIYEQLQRQH